MCVMYQASPCPAAEEVAELKRITAVGAGSWKNAVNYILSRKLDGKLRDHPVTSGVLLEFAGVSFAECE